MNQFVEEYDAVLTELRSFQEGGIISRAAAREAVEARRGGARASAPRGAFDAGSAVGYGSRRNLREEHRRIEEWEVAKEMLQRWDEAQRGDAPPPLTTRPTQRHSLRSSPAQPGSPRSPPAASPAKKAE